MPYAARKPEHNGILGLTVSVLELIRGAGRDLLGMLGLSNCKLYPIYDSAVDDLRDKDILPVAALASI